MKAQRVAVMFGVLVAATPAYGAAQSLSEVFRKVDPSVVVVFTREKGIVSDASSPVDIARWGSGVVVSPDGEILTAATMVQTADAIAVQFRNGEIATARVVSSEPAADVALLRLDRPSDRLAVAPVGDSDSVQVGDQVFVVGAPLGTGHALTVGHVSARRPSHAASAETSLAEFFQIDAAITQGDSGGPLFDMAGEVIGIVTRIDSRSSAPGGLGLAVTSNVARRLVLEERSFWSGLSGTLLSGDLAAVFNLPPPGSGLLVQAIASGSPAERIGLRAGFLPATIGDEDLIVGGDVILAVQGIRLSGPDGYLRVRRMLRNLQPGEPVTVTILRAGARLNLTGTGGDP